MSAPKPPEIGQPIRHYEHAAIVVWVWSLDCIDLVYWDRFEKRWIEVSNAYRGSWSEVGS